MLQAFKPDTSCHPWLVNQNKLKLILQNATCLAPHTSKCLKHPPMTLDDIKVIWTFLDLDNPCNAAIYACMVVIFYSIACLGEFMVSVITKFDPTKHIMCWNISFLQDQYGLPVIKLALPVTKCVPDVLQHHFLINPAPPNAHLFAQKHLKNSLHLLSKTQFISRITAIAKHCDLTDLKGHSLHISGTFFYLLKGVPFDIVKVMGRWAGEAFTLYLCHHILVLTFFLQANQPVLEAFNHIAMPSVCWCKSSCSSKMAPKHCFLHQHGS